MSSQSWQPGTPFTRADMLALPKMKPCWMCYGDPIQKCSICGYTGFIEDDQPFTGREILMIIAPNRVAWVEFD